MPRSFTETIQELNSGGFVEDCATRLLEVAKAVEDTGGKGSIIVELKLSWNGDNTVVVTPDVRIKKPGKRRQPSVMFKGRDGLSVNNPNQGNLFDVTKIREIGTAKE